MEPHITCQPVRVAVGKTGEQGFLVFADGLLMAVITHLHAVDERLEGKWFVEAGFGPCNEIVPPIFDSPDEAQRWVFRAVQASRPKLFA
jgi:hypothetical protein